MTSISRLVKITLVSHLYCSIMQNCKLMEMGPSTIGPRTEGVFLVQPFFRQGYHAIRYLQVKSWSTKWLLHRELSSPIMNEFGKAATSIQKPLFEGKSSSSNTTKGIMSKVHERMCAWLRAWLSLGVIVL